MRVSTPVRLGAADAFDREVLDGAQQLGLGRDRQVGDFVKRQRATVGTFELPAPARTPMAVR